MFKNKIITSIVMALIVISMVGCKKISVGDIELEGAGTALYIQKDGSVLYGVKEKFDKDYYNKNDLEEKIEKEVDDYNNSGKESISDAIKIDDFEAKDDMAVLVLNINGLYDFNRYQKDFNGMEKDEFYIGDIGENKDCEITGAFITPEDSNTVITADIIENLENEKIVIVNEQMQIEIEGNVKYISSNCKVNDKGIITTTSADNGKSYVVYTLDE